MLENPKIQAQLHKLADLMSAQHKNLVTAESCTGGGLAFALTSIPGSSSFFERGYVTYSNDAKIELLGVEFITLEKHGAVSAATASEMAKGALVSSHADLALSVTGIAGPDGATSTKPVGTVIFGLADLEQDTVQTRHQLFEGDRSQIRDQSILFALSWLIEHLTQRAKS